MWLAVLCLCLCAGEVLSRRDKAISLPNDTITWCKRLRYLGYNSTLVSLASYPSSGNTWLRYMLQQVTGIYTGSIYDDYDLVNTQFARNRLSSVLAVKTFDLPEKMPPQFKNSKCILLIRNVRDTILSHFHYLYGKNHIGHAPAPIFEGAHFDDDTEQKSVKWEEFVVRTLSEWTEFYLAWMNDHYGRKHIVFYELLTSETEKTLKGILEFLGQTHTKADLDCALQRRGSPFRRKKPKRQPDHFTPEQNVLITEHTDRVLKEIQIYQERHRIPGW